MVKIVWFSGLPGSGKTTIAEAVKKVLDENNIKSYILDGDVLRKGINSDLGFSLEDRTENLRRVNAIVDILMDLDVLILASFITPFEETRSLLKNKHGNNILEVYVKCDINECIKRDPKGMYKKALAGEIPNFTGISAKYEVPISPDLTLDTQKLTIEECVRDLYDRI